MRLARDTVLDSLDGKEAWEELAAAVVPFALHVWVADELASGRGTVCALKGEWPRKSGAESTDPPATFHVLVPPQPPPPAPPPPPSLTSPRLRPTCLPPPSTRACEKLPREGRRTPRSE